MNGLRVMSKLIRLNPLNGKTNDSNVLFAKNLLLNGDIIGLPTDTIYGLAVSALNDSAIHKLYKLKGRESSKPIAICVSDVKQLNQLCRVTVEEQLLRDLLPGAVTLVFKRSEHLNQNLNPSHDSIGVRIPDHSFVRQLCSVCGPLGLTSANISSESSCLSVNEFQHLWPHLSAIFDGGLLGQSDPKRLGSTVVDFSAEGYFKIIRSGCAFDRTVSLLQNKYHLKRL